MNYHNINHFDMLNGDGIRVVLFVSGCRHHCKGCQNEQTWNVNSGINFDQSAIEELLEALKPGYIKGLTLSGGDPLHEDNLAAVSDLIDLVKSKYPNKDIWIYSGYTINDILNSHEPDMAKRSEIIKKCDVFVDGKFELDKLDVSYPFAGSTNQNIIYMKDI